MADSEGIQLNAFELKDDFTADVEITDASGLRTLTGNWVLSPEKKVTGVSVGSDIALAFSHDSTHIELSFDVNEERRKIILSRDEGKFERE